MTTLFNDDLYDATSGLLKEPGSGIGIAPEQGQAAPPSMWDRIGTALYNFGAGSRGEPLWDERKEALEQKKRKAQLEEFNTQVGALEQGVKLLEGLEGEQRAQFMASYRERLEKLSPGLGATYEAVAARPSLLTKFEKYLPNLPEPLQLLARSDPKAFMKFAGTDAGVKALTDAMDKSELRSATRKIQTLRAGWQQVVPEDMRDLIKDGLTASDVMAVQSHLPAALRFSDTEVDAIKRNDKVFFSGTGVLHGEGELKVLESRAKKGSLAPQHLEVDGKKYQFDPDKKLQGERHKTDDRYVLMGKTTSGDSQEALTPATISVNGKNVAALVDKKGNYFDANTRKPIKEGIGPQITAADEQRNRELEGRAQAVEDLGKAVDALEKLAKNHPRSAAGLFAAPARAIEYVAGSLNPEGEPGQATSALQLRDMLIANMHNLSRLSNEERRRIESSLSIGPGGNPRNLPEGIRILRAAIAKERAEVGAPRARPKAGGKNPKDMTNEELLKALKGG